MQRNARHCWKRENREGRLQQIACDIKKIVRPAAEFRIRGRLVLPGMEHREGKPNPRDQNREDGEFPAGGMPPCLGCEMRWHRSPLSLENLEERHLVYRKTRAKSCNDIEDGTNRADRATER